MKTNIEVKGKVYERADLVRERYGISVTTERRLRLAGVLPAPLRLGRKSYYCVADLEDRLAASAH
jgi:hypothetical protein